MKPTDISDALNGVDPGFVKESEPEPAKGKKVNGKIVARIAALAAALAVIIGVGTVIARHGAKDPTPSIQTTETQQATEQTDAPVTAAQPPEQDGDAAQSLLRSLTAYAAEYPAQGRHPADPVPRRAPGAP